MIELRNVRKSYSRGESETIALDGVSLSIHPGEFVSVMGPSGSGKSTMLHLMGALDTPTSGDVVLGGDNTAQMNEHALTLLRRRRLGFVFQFFNLLPTMTALENVSLPALLVGASRAAAEAKAAKLLDVVGLGKRRQHRPEQLSGGEMQRVAIARALVNDPIIVLADEPTGNLDSATGKDVLALLRTLTHEQQLTLVMVTHDPNAAAVGDRIVRLRDGRLVDETVTAVA